MMSDSSPKDRVVVFAAAGPNAKTVMDVLTRAGFLCRPAENADAFCEYLAQEIGTAIILDEVLTAENIPCIRDYLQRQPSWSDIPLILLVRRTPADMSALEIFGPHKHLIVLEMPIYTASLISLVRSSLQIRRRQYENRDLIDELQHARDELLSIQGMLENKNKEMESIIGIVSHDLRAPLVNIDGFSTEIAMDCQTLRTLLSDLSMDKNKEDGIRWILQDSIPQSLKFIHTSSAAMNNLVMALVEVARVGLAPFRPQRLDMNEVISKIMENLTIKFREAHVDYHQSPLPDCFADPAQVTQIFTNLLDNAVKYLDPARPGQIRMDGKTQSDGVLYRISDNGIGILPQDQEKIFEPYHQLKKKTAGGIGLGLATVKKMIDRNNGKIRVASQKDKGSTFYVVLPKPDADASNPPPLQ